jgi:drug/metabolite transporter (DMT)-like permease
VSPPNPIDSRGAVPLAAEKPRSPTMGLAEYGLITLQSILWGSTFFFVSLVGREVPPVTMGALRLVPASLLLLAVIAWLGLRLPADLSVWARMLVLAAFNNMLPFILIALAQREVTGGVAAVFNATAPLFAVLLAPAFVPEEYLSWRRIVGVLAGVGGVAVLIGAVRGGASVSLHSGILLLSAAFCYASANIMTRRFFGGYPPFVIAAAHMLAALAIGIVASVVIDQPWTRPMPSHASLVAIAAMGVFGSALASLCHFTVLRRAGPTNAMLVTIILPLTPILLGALFLGDRMSAHQVAGASLIALALIIIDGRLLTRNAYQRAPTP